nr:unnamed protein product [Callosobruchus analis]
MFVFKNFTI